MQQKHLGILLLSIPPILLFVAVSAAVIRAVCLAFASTATPNAALFLMAARILDDLQILGFIGFVATLVLCTPTGVYYLITSKTNTADRQRAIGIAAMILIGIFGIFAVCMILLLAIFGTA